MTPTTRCCRSSTLVLCTEHSTGRVKHTTLGLNMAVMPAIGYRPCAPSVGMTSGHVKCTVRRRGWPRVHEGEGISKPLPRRRVPSSRRATRAPSSRLVVACMLLASQSQPNNRVIELSSYRVNIGTPITRDGRSKYCSVSQAECKHSLPGSDTGGDRLLRLTADPMHRRSV